MHKNGITGEGINIAVIDNGFINTPTEIDGKIKIIMKVMVLVEIIIMEK